MAELRRQRSAVVMDSDARLRQIERNLHDGTQAQLVAIGMQVSMAQARLETDADRPAAAAILAETGNQVRTALAELRDIARGAHPPALDAGLPVALETLAARTPLSVAITIEPGVSELDIPPATASIAYHAVAELLTNVVKHGGASQAQVNVSRETSEVGRRRDPRMKFGMRRTKSGGDKLVITVWDDGSGGAVLSSTAPDHALIVDASSSTHSGLSGIADRVAAIDGTLDISSPLGGPTVVTIILPL